MTSEVSFLVHVDKVLDERLQIRWIHFAALKNYFNLKKKLDSFLRKFFKQSESIST